jgi:hypothetical protein
MFTMFLVSVVLRGKSEAAQKPVHWFGLRKKVGGGQWSVVDGLWSIIHGP